MTIIVSLISFEVLEIPNPPVSETRPSNFAKLGSAEQIVALYVGRKLEHPVWQTGTTVFLENQIFLDLIKNLMLAMPNHLPQYFHPWKHVV
jgi:hypothetical protein